MNGRTIDWYSSSLGKVVANLHSLEVIIRLFLHEVDKDKYSKEAREFSWDTVKVGDMVPENYFTNYHTLGKLLDKYNELISIGKKPALRIDKDIVELRDCLAHGRVLGGNPEGESMKLWKFGDKVAGQIPVSHVFDLTEIRLKELIHDTFQAVQKVRQACRLFVPSFPG